MTGLITWISGVGSDPSSNNLWTFTIIFLHLNSSLYKLLGGGGACWHAHTTLNI